jgi:hypothetical protein
MDKKNPFTDGLEATEKFCSERVVVDMSSILLGVDANKGGEE